MLAMERSHRLRDDLDWLPPAARRARRATLATMWGGSALAVGAAVVVAPLAVAVAWKGLVLAGGGLAVAGHHAGRLALQRQLQRMGRGEVPLRELEAEAEGELVVVRGTVEAETTIPGLLLDATGVYRRMVWQPDGRWVSEAAVDFALVDIRGRRVLVQAAGARWMTPNREPWTYPLARIDREGVAPALRSLARSSGAIALQAAEQVLEVGAEVQVVGYKTASPDVGGAVVDYRLPPQRATLRSGPDLPLVITRVRDLERPPDDD